MTFGTSKVFKSGTGLAINISKNCIDDQKLVRGCVVQYDMTKLNIPPKEPEHFKKEEIKEQEVIPV